MYDKFVIFAVFAVLVQHGLAATPYGLSTDQTETFKEILTLEDGMLELKYKAANSLFDLLDKIATGLIWSNCETDFTSDIETTGEAVTVDWQNTVVYIRQVFELAQGESYSSLEDVKTTTDELISSSVANLGAALTIAISEDSTENQLDAIKTLTDAAWTDLEEFVAVIYDAFRDCFETIDDDGETTIQAAADGSTVGLLRMINAISNAIGAIRTATLSGSADTSLLSVLAENRDAALKGLRHDVEHKVSWVKALYLKEARSELGLLVSSIYKIVYAQFAPANRYVAATETTYTTIASYSSSYANGVSDTGKAEVSSADIAQLQTTLRYDAGLDILIDSAPESDADSAAKKTQFQEYFHNFAAELSRLYYLAINYAMVNNIEGIEELRATTLAGLSEFSAQTVELIGGDTTETDSESEITEPQNDLIEAAARHCEAVYDGANLLANFVSGNTAIEDYTAELASSKNEGSAAIVDATYAIAEIRLVLAQSSATAE